jgi:sugar phosphate isomerase/epimerase
MSYHIKDKTGPAHATPDQNRPWGQGETPLRAILQAHRQNKWKSVATIELEYTIPDGSDAVKEVGKCLDYCRQLLA